MMALAAVCFLWAGMILGIPFLETPVKFTVPSVTLPIGLDIGRHVFGAFNKVEIALALLVCGLVFASRVGRAVQVSLALVSVIVALQSVWLLPLLDARVGFILNGQTPPPAPHHILYFALEVIKVACLLAAGFFVLKASQRAARIAPDALSAP